MIESVPLGREISDVYLKHPGNESSDDEEGTEEGIEDHDYDSKEENLFQNFISTHQKKEEKKTTSLGQPGPSNSRS